MNIINQNGSGVATPGLLTALTGRAISLSERGWLPDAVLRAGMRRLLAERLREIHAPDPAAAAGLTTAFADSLRGEAVAVL